MADPTPYLLLAEDEAGHAAAIQRALREAGPKVELQVVGTLHACQAALTARTPDLLLLDLNFPDGNALEVLSSLAQSDAFPILVMTSLGNEQIAVDAMKAGALDYIIKSPGSFALIPKIVERGLREWQLHQDRKRAEEALEAQRWRLESILEATHVGTWEWNVQTGETIFNETWAQIVGYTLAELEPVSIETWMALAHPEDLKRSSATMERHFAGELPYYDVECRMKHKDGEWVWVHDRGRVITRNADGSPLMMFGTHTDITERKRAEEAVRKIYTAVEQSPVSVVITDTKGAIEYVNPKFTELTGYTLAEVLGQNPRVLKSGELPQEAYKELWNTILEGEVWRGEFHNKKKNGELYWEVASISPIRDAHGVITSFVAVKEDITARKQVEDALRSSEAHYHSLVEGTPGIVYIFSSLRGGQYYSSRVTEILGYSPEQLYAQPLLWRNAIHPDDVSRVEQCTHEAMEGRPFSVEYRIRDVQGNWHWFDDRSTELKTDGTEVTIEGFVLDITDRKQAEKVRLELERQVLHDHRVASLGVLAGGIAHDFNNILTAILGNAEVALYRTVAGDPLRKNVENIQLAGKRAKELVQKILLFSRQGELTRIPLVVAQAIEDALKLLRSVIPSTITIQVEVDTGEATVLMDPGEMNQVLMNLCVNAAHSMRERVLGTLSISAYRRSRNDVDWIEFVVGDNGSGIPPEITSRIFDPFFTTKAVDEGTGLGLSVVHGIIQRAGGSIEVESEVGSGTQFRILLPEVQVPSASQPPREHSGNRPSLHGHILLVDDEPAIREILGQSLISAGCTVEVCADGQAALDMLLARPGAFDAVISDQTMPRMTGLQFAQNISQIQRGLPFILMTGMTSNIDVPTLKSAGISTFLTKPVLPSDVISALELLLVSAPEKRGM